MLFSSKPHLNSALLTAAETFSVDRDCEVFTDAVERRACFVEEAVRPLDARRLEIRQELFTSDQKDTLDYQVETWFFLPTSLQINRWTYPPQNLQLGLKNYIRLGVPLCRPQSLLPRDARISGAEETMGSALISRVSACLDRIIAEETVDPAIIREYEDAIKRYVLLCRSALLRCRRLLLEDRDAARRDAAAQEFVVNFSRAVRQYRSLSPQAQRVREHVHVPTFLYCDEYLSVLASEGVSQILRLLREGSVKRHLQAFCVGQMAYRRKFFPGSIPVEDSANEEPAFRWSILKKYVDMPLFLEIRPRAGTSMLAHSLYGIAAALAMIFATAVAYIGQGHFGQLSTPLFAALVISYIFKDRLKDVSRSYLFNLFRRWLPDRRQDLLDSANQQVGRCRESFRFLNWDALPQDVREIRNRTHFVEILNSFHSEDIFHYSKEVHIFKLPTPFIEGRRSLLDISRLDIGDFLRHVEEALNCPARVEERLVPGEKIYHIDMVRRITYEGTSGLERFRIVIASAGIRRIEVVEPLLQR